MASVATHSKLSRLPKTLATLRQKLTPGDNVYSLLLSSGSPLLAELTGLVGYDAVIVDLEDGDSSNLLRILQALSASQTAALVRVPEGEPAYIKPALNLGAAGVIVPAVDSAEGARRAVACCRICLNRSSAIKGVSRRELFGLPQSGEDAGYTPVMILQIDSDVAVSRIPEIAAVDGVDCLLLHHDQLTASFLKSVDGTPDDAHRFQRRAEELTLQSGKLLGGFTSSSMGMTFQDMASRGYSLIVGGSDVALLREALCRDLVAVRGAPVQVVEGQPAVSLHTAIADGIYQRAPHFSHPSLASYLQTAAQAVSPPAAAQSRRGGKGTPKKCSQCGMALKEGHKPDCPALSRPTNRKRAKVMTDGVVQPGTGERNGMGHHGGEAYQGEVELDLHDAAEHDMGRMEGGYGHETAQEANELAIYGARPADPTMSGRSGGGKGGRKEGGRKPRGSKKHDARRGNKMDIDLSVTADGHDQ